jgi:hypothetical protein
MIPFCSFFTSLRKGFLLTAQPVKAQQTNIIDMAEKKDLIKIPKATFIPQISAFIII